MNLSIKTLLIILSISFLSACGDTEKIDEKIPEKKALSQSEEPDAEDVEKHFDCSMLKYPSFQEQCKNRQQRNINGFFQNEIQFSFDLERCVDLQDAEECREFILSSGVSGPISFDDSKALKDALSQMREEDISSPCVELNVGNGLKNYCENRHLKIKESQKLRNVKRDGKISDCDKFLNELNKERCLNFFKPQKVEK